MSASLPPRILVIRRRYLGDIVLLGSFLRNLRLRWPDAHITVFAEPRFAGAYSLHPEVDRILTQPKGNPIRWLAVWHVLFWSRFTHVFDLDGNDRTALLTGLTRAPFRARLQMRTSLRSCYTHSLPVDFEAYHRNHITVTQSALLTAAGVPLATTEVKIVPRAADLEFVRNLLAPALASGRPLILLHPGSRSPFRVWPPERFARIIDRVQTELSAQVCLIAGPAEAGLLGEIRQHLRTSPTVIDTPLTIPQFAALASLFRLMLCHDSGPMHVAAAVGTPVIALLGSQNPATFAPLGEGHVILQAPLPCTSCVSPGVCVPGDSYRNHCIRNISEDQVFAALQMQLARRA